jgi:hypothetical protein
MKSAAKNSSRDINPHSSDDKPGFSAGLRFTARIVAAMFECPTVKWQRQAGTIVPVIRDVL